VHVCVQKPLEDILQWLHRGSVTDSKDDVGAEFIKSSGGVAGRRLLQIHSQFAHVVRHYPLRQRLNIADVPGGIRIEHFASYPLLFAYKHWLATCGQRDKEYIALNLRGCVLYLDYILSRVKKAQMNTPQGEKDQALRLINLENRVRGIATRMNKMANDAKKEGRQETEQVKQNKRLLAWTKEDTTMQGLSEVDKRQKEGEEQMKERLGVDARVELTLTDCCLTACAKILELLPKTSSGYHMPIDPLSRHGRDLASALEQTLLRGFMLGMIIPPTRVSVLCSCKWALTSEMGSMECPRKDPTTAEGYKCGIRGCPGNVLWLPDNFQQPIAMDWRHHKAAERDPERVFAIKISDPRMDTIMKAWCMWGRPVLYFGKKDNTCIPKGEDPGWLFMNRWTSTGKPVRLTTTNFSAFFRKVCFMTDKWCCQKVSLVIA
jgi:hypothetical protein